MHLYTKCDCSCHTAHERGAMMMHITACCDNGFAWVSAHDRKLIQMCIETTLSSLPDDEPELAGPIEELIKLREKYKIVDVIDPKNMW